MDLLIYIERGGIIVDILIFMNIIGFTIMFWKSYVFYKIHNNIETISDEIVEELKLATNHHLAQIHSTVALKVKSVE